MQCEKAAFPLGRSALERLEEGNKVSFGAVRNFAGCFCSRPVCSIVSKVLFVCICRLCVPCRAVLCARRERKWKETNRPIDRPTERASIEGHSTWTVSTLWTFWAVLLSLEPLLEMLLLSLVYPLCEQASERMNEGRKQTSRVVKVSNLFPDSFAVWIQPLSIFSAVFRAPPLGSVRVFCHVTMA